MNEKCQKLPFTTIATTVFTAVLTHTHVGNFTLETKSCIIEYFQYILVVVIVVVYLFVLFTNLVRSKSRIVQLFDGIFHVFVSQKLHHSGTIFVCVGKADVAGFTHMILQVLP